MSSFLVLLSIHCTSICISTHMDGPILLYTIIIRVKKNLKLDLHIICCMFVLLKIEVDWRQQLTRYY